MWADGLLSKCAQAFRGWSGATVLQVAIKTLRQKQRRATAEGPLTIYILLPDDFLVSYWITGGWACGGAGEVEGRINSGTLEGQDAGI